MKVLHSNQTWIVAAWLLVTVIYAVVYVRQALGLPGLEGYEKDWQFQLLAFCYARLPLLVLLLVVGLIAERFARRRRSTRSHRS